jgi:hypothetical protein
LRGEEFAGESFVAEGEGSLPAEELAHYHVVGLEAIKQAVAGFAVFDRLAVEEAAPEAEHANHGVTGGRIYLDAIQVEVENLA